MLEGEHVEVRGGSAPVADEIGQDHRRSGCASLAPTQTCSIGDTHGGDVDADVAAAVLRQAESGARHLAWTGAALELLA